MGAAPKYLINLSFVCLTVNHEINKSKHDEAASLGDQIALGQG